MHDTGLYHAQIIRWYSSVGAAPGMALLHHRLGFHSGVFALAAGFDIGRRSAVPAPPSAWRPCWSRSFSPRIKSLLKSQVAEAQARPDVPAVILDAALLLEANWRDLCDTVLFLDAPFAGAVGSGTPRPGMGCRGTSLPRSQPMVVGTETQGGRRCYRQHTRRGRRTGGRGTNPHPNHCEAKPHLIAAFLVFPTKGDSDRGMCATSPTFSKAQKAERHEQASQAATEG